MNYNNAKSLLSLALLQSLTLRETINNNPEKADTIIEAVEEIVKDVKKSLPKKRISKSKPVIKEEDIVSDEEINSMIKQIENEEKITKKDKEYLKMVEEKMKKDLKGEVNEC